MILPFYIPRRVIFFDKDGDRVIVSDKITDKIDFECIATAPTLVFSLMFIVLYAFDQVQNLIEQMYLATQLFTNLVAVMICLLDKGPKDDFTYEMIHGVLMLLMFIDFVLILNERGYALCKKMEDEICT